MWRDNLLRVIRLQEEEIALVRQMMAQTDHPERLRTFAELLARKSEAVAILYQLLNYSDKDKT